MMLAAIGPLALLVRTGVGSAFGLGLPIRHRDVPIDAGLAFPSMALIVDTLAPTFGGARGASSGSLKLVRIRVHRGLGRRDSSA